ncbi:MAG: hypothetical protein ACOWYE_16825 [Desulfatiglandales bacterium]
MGWILYAAGTAVALAAADFFIKLAAGRISNSLALLLYGSCTFLCGMSWFLMDRIRGMNLHAETPAVVAALCVGVAFSAVTIGLYMTFAAGAPISLGSPLVRLGAVFITGLAGVLLLHEPLTLRYISGMVLTAVGVYLIITR